MRKVVASVAVLLFALPLCVAQSQSPAISPERQAAITEASRRLNDPVQFVLQHRAELGLTNAQVSALEKLATALRDSSSARAALLLKQAQKNATLPGMANAMEWTGPIDESAIRESARQQSAVQAEIMLATARDRRSVGALLNPEQRLRLPQLQMAEMRKAAQNGGK